MENTRKYLGVVIENVGVSWYVRHEIGQHKHFSTLSAAKMFIRTYILLQAK